MIEETKKQISDLRASLDREHEKWFTEAQTLAENVGEKMTLPRITGIQRYRVQMQLPTDLNSTSDYYRINYSVKVVDHLLSEFERRFSDDSIAEDFGSIICSQPFPCTGGVH